MEGLGKDVRFALRMLRRTPGVSAAAIIALALGIGANTAIFSVVDGVLLRPLPYPESSQLVSIRWRYPSLGRPAALSYPEYKDILQQTRTLANVAVYEQLDANLETATSPPERIGVGVMSATLLPTLGVAPMLGRNFTADEERQGSDQVAILTYATWRDRFGADQKIVGRTLTLDGLPYHIVGVMPAGFRFGDVDDLWIPLSTSNPQVSERGSHWLKSVGRMKPGVTAAQLDQDLAAIAQRTIESDRRIYRSDYRLVEQPLIAQVVGDVQLALWVLLGAVALVLLIACANVANLLLARATARRREMAVRTALGASRLRLMRQLLTESLLLSLAGGGLGVLLASWGVDGLLALAPDALPRAHDVALDGRVLAFTAAIALGTGVAFGLIPALAASRPDLHDSLKEGTRGTTVGRGRLGKALVVGEVAVSLVLLVGTGLMVRSFLRLRAVDRGFRADHALTLSISLPVPDSKKSDADRERFVHFFGAVGERLAQLPGVSAVGGIDNMPLTRHTASDVTFDIEGFTPADPADTPDCEMRIVAGDWFSAMGIPVVRGRGFLASDTATSLPVVVVNRAWVKKYSPDREALGRRVRQLGRRLRQIEAHHATPPWATIVGVIGDVRGYGLDQPTQAEMYWPLAQKRDASDLTMVARTSGDPAALAGAARAAVAEVDASQPVFDVKPLEDYVGESLAQRRFTLTLMTLFGLVALLLAAVGIYGVMAYTVAQRTQEIGIRVALGATSATVLGMVLRDGMKLVALGLVLGGVAALALTRVGASLLWGVSSTDAATYLVIAATLAAVALVAILIPARRATRVDPMQALRAE